MVEGTPASRGTDAHLEEAVAGGSNDGNDVEAVAARAAGRPKRTIKRREILDPSHVARRTSVAANRQKSPSPSPNRATPIAHSSPLSLSQIISPDLVLASPIRSPEVSTPPQRRERVQTPLQEVRHQNSPAEAEHSLATADLSLPSVSRRNYESEGIRAEPPIDPSESVLEVIFGMPMFSTVTSANKESENGYTYK
ncbi:uncharacterized protein LOC124207625 [Daphnia pulex]|uniref:uncharacterized protein LOC124207625 n=1 Tax=Daphnia pulex TaxID=6669 RepID=UPI001EDFC4B0|nr:uncharacterized protein LOC124207625 [Daphnia pulex]